MQQSSIGNTSPEEDYRKAFTCYKNNKPCTESHLNANIVRELDLCTTCLKILYNGCLRPIGKFELITCSAELGYLFNRSRPAAFFPFLIFVGCREPGISEEALKSTSVIILNTTMSV